MLAAGDPNYAVKDAVLSQIDGMDLDLSKNGATKDGNCCIGYQILRSTKCRVFLAHCIQNAIADQNLNWFEPICIEPIFNDPNRAKNALLDLYSRLGVDQFQAGLAWMPRPAIALKHPPWYKSAMADNDLAHIVSNFAARICYILWPLDSDILPRNKQAVQLEAAAGSSFNAQEACMLSIPIWQAYHRSGVVRSPKLQALVLLQSNVDLVHVHAAVSDLDDGC